VPINGFYWWNRHCEKAFSADEAILQRSLLSKRIKIASFLAMTRILWVSVYDSLSKSLL